MSDDRKAPKILTPHNDKMTRETFCRVMADAVIVATGGAGIGTLAGAFKAADHSHHAAEFNTRNLVQIFVDEYKGDVSKENVRKIIHTFIENKLNANGDIQSAIAGTSAQFKNKLPAKDVVEIINMYNIAALGVATRIDPKELAKGIHTISVTTYELGAAGAAIGGAIGAKVDHETKNKDRASAEKKANDWRKRLDSEKTKDNSGPPIDH